MFFKRTNTNEIELRNNVCFSRNNVSFPLFQTHEPPTKQGSEKLESLGSRLDAKSAESHVRQLEKDILTKMQLAEEATAARDVLVSVCLFVWLFVLLFVAPCASFNCCPSSLPAGYHVWSEFP